LFEDPVILRAKPEESSPKEFPPIAENTGNRGVFLTVIKKDNASAPAANRDIAESLMDVRVKITVEIGHARMPIADILKLQPGQMVALQEGANDPLKIFVNDKLFAYGEAVEVNGKTGVRIRQVIAKGKADPVKRSA